MKLDGRGVKKKLPRVDSRRALDDLTDEQLQGHVAAPRRSLRRAQRISAARPASATHVLVA
jgi:hypothetical protein